jgi:hypothetical protein
MSADTNANIEDVVTVVDNLDSDAPVAMEIEDKLTEVTTADPQQAHELVSDALDLGVLDEDKHTLKWDGRTFVCAECGLSSQTLTDHLGHDLTPGMSDSDHGGEA